MNENHLGGSNEYDDAELAATAEQFEALLSEERTPFFDETTFESLAGYYFLQNRLEMTLKVCEIGLQTYPMSQDLFVAKIQVHIAQENFDAALDALDAAELLGSSNQELTLMRGIVLTLTGETDQAIEVFRELLLYAEEKDAVYFYLGQAFYHAQELEKAVHCYRKAIRINPENDPAFYEYVLCQEALEKLEEAQTFLEEVTEQSPFSAGAWFALGMCYGQLQLTKRAITAYDYAKTIREDFPMAWFNLGHCYMNTERYEEAFEMYQKAVELEKQPSAEWLTYVGAALEKMQRNKEALAIYKQASKLDEACDEAWYGMASVLYDEQRYLEAIHFVQKAIKLSDEKSDYYLLLADTEAQLGNEAASVEAYNMAANLDAKNPDIWLNWSLLYYEQDAYGKAFEVIYDGISELPDDADLHYRAAAFLILEGRLTDAFKYLETALLLNYDGHEQMYEFFPDVEMQKKLFRFISNYKD